MAELVPAKVWTLELFRKSGEKVVFSLLHPDVTWVRTSATRMARHFASAFQKKVLEEGEYLQALSAVPTLQLEKDRLEVTLPKPRNPHLFPEIPVSFDIFVAQLPDESWLGFVPTLGVEAYAPTQEELPEHLKEIILLEFARHKRLRSAHAIAPLFWWDETAAEEHDVELEFYTLSELEDLQNRRKKRMIPEVATKLLRSKQSTFGMDKPLEQLSRVGRGRYYRSILLVGPSGCGKTALIEEWERTKHKHGLANTPIWETTAARLIQKLTDASGWQENLSKLCEELYHYDDILYITNFAQLFEVGRYVGNRVSMGEYLRDPVGRGQLVLLSECTEEEYAKIELDYPGVLPLFQVIRLNEPKGEDLTNIVQAKGSWYASKYNMEVTDDALVECVSLHQRFTPYSGFPGKPLRFLESMLIDAKHKRSDPRTIDRSYCVHHFCEQTGLPEFLVSPDVPMPTKECEGFFQQQLFGQDEAVQVVVDALISLKAGLARQGKPIVSMLFVGPTGVGKTELAKLLAEYLFSSRERMVRFDMSEFSDPYNVMRLTGENMTQEGLLTSVVREQPFCVLLFDELEKADPSFYDLLLQILGAGRLTDGKGRTTDFCSTVIIMTSNLGAGSLQRGSVGFSKGDVSQDHIKEHFEKAAQKEFRPELYNRIDRIVPFAALERNTMRSILTRELSLIREREGIRHREVTLDVAEEAQVFLGQQGYNPAYGARHLQRTIRDNMLVQLAEHLNQHIYEKPLNADVFHEDTTLQVRVQESKDVSHKARQVLGTSLTLVELANQITHGRREAQCFDSGPAMLELRSELDILERRKRRNEDEFWKNVAQGKWYSTCLDISHACTRSLEDVQQQENDVLVSLLGSHPPDPKSTGMFNEWRRAFQDLKVRLYTTLHPEENRSTLAIYGDHLYLEELLKVYQDLSEAKGYNLVPQALWMKAGLKTWRQGMPMEKGDDRVVGVVAGMEGDGVHLYLGDEGGRHVWTNEENQELDYVVTFAPISPASYKRPKDVHRKQFFESFKVRRTHAHRIFYDKRYDLRGSAKECISLLIKHLDQRFLKIVDQSVLGLEEDPSLTQQGGLA